MLLGRSAHGVRVRLYRFSHSKGFLASGRVDAQMHGTARQGMVDISPRLCGIKPETWVSPKLASAPVERPDHAVFAVL